MDFLLQMAPVAALSIIKGIPSVSKEKLSIGWVLVVSILICKGGYKVGSAVGFDLGR